MILTGDARERTLASQCDSVGQSAGEKVVFKGRNQRNPDKSKEAIERNPEVQKKV